MDWSVHLDSIFALFLGFNSCCGDSVYITLNLNISICWGWYSSCDGVHINEIFHLFWPDIWSGWIEWYLSRSPFVSLDSTFKPLLSSNMLVNEFWNWIRFRICFPETNPEPREALVWREWTLEWFICWIDVAWGGWGTGPGLTRQLHFCQNQRNRLQSQVHHSYHSYVLMLFVFSLRHGPQWYHILWGECILFYLWHNLHKIVQKRGSSSSR